MTWDRSNVQGTCAAIGRRDALKQLTAGVAGFAITLTAVSAPASSAATPAPSVADVAELERQTTRAMLLVLRTGIQTWRPSEAPETLVTRIHAGWTTIVDDLAGRYPAVADSIASRAFSTLVLAVEHLNRLVDRLEAEQGAAI